MALWGNQTLLDEAVTQLTRLLSLPRRCINITATSKGLVAGTLTFVDGDDRLVDCQTPTGTTTAQHHKNNNRSCHRLIEHSYIHSSCAASFLCFPFRFIHDFTPGILIPSDVDKLSQFRSKAFCILVVEKDSTFQKLLDDKIERFIGDCILITVGTFTTNNFSLQLFYSAHFLRE